MAGNIRPIALAVLFNLSKTEDGGNNLTFSIHEIATHAAQLFALDYDDLRNSLSEFLAGAVTSGQDNYFTGDPRHEFYMLTHAGQDFQATIVAAANEACQQNKRTTASVTTTSRSSSSSSPRFIPGTLVLSAAGAQDDDDATDDSRPDGGVAPAARDKSATAKLALSSSSSQGSETQSSAYNDMMDERGRQQPSTGTYSRLLSPEP